MSKQGKRSFYRQWNQDKNAKLFDEILKRYGIHFSVGRPGDGYDRLVMLSPMELWEIKNPEQPKELTEAEKLKQAYCETHGIPYRIFEYVEEAEKLLFNRKENTTLTEQV